MYQAITTFLFLLFLKIKTIIIFMMVISGTRNFYRFSKRERMEYQEIVCTDRQNVPKNGFGRNRTQPNLMDVFAKFYGLEYFPSFDETRQDFNGPVYLKRIQVFYFYFGEPRIICY
jgi:hypothetical protein